MEQTVQQVKQRLESDPSPLFLDVREEHELSGELGSLPGIRHIPVGSVSCRLDELQDVRDREIVTICKMGGRSRTAAQILKDAGFQRVVVMTGGMTAWVQAGFPSAPPEDPDS